jgi:hypothetical protein
VVERLTLDTNVLQEYWLEQAKQHVVQQLLDLRRTGEVELVVTTRISDDIPGGALADRIRELPGLGIGRIGSVFRLNSALDGPDMFGSDVFLRLQEDAITELQRRGRRVPDQRDWEHLHGHFLKHRDVFLTWDKRLLEAAGLIGRHLPVTAQSPDSYLVARSIARDVATRTETEHNAL